MAANRTPSPRTLSPEIPVVSYPTPNIGDLMVVQDVDTRVPGYVALEYGDPHPDSTNFPGLKLVSQAPLDQENNHMWVRRIYAKDRLDEDAYNYALKYSANNPDYPIYIRAYTLLRADYVPLPAGSPDPAFPAATLISEEVVRLKGDAEDGALDSLYVKVIRTFETLPGPVITRYETNDQGQIVEVSTQRKFYGDGYVPPTADALTSFGSEIGEDNVITDVVRTVPEVFDAKSFSAERPDPVPVKFRVAVPAVTEEETIAGTAASPSLSTGELVKSEEQQTKFTKRKRKTSRSSVSLPSSLVQTSTTREKQVATVTETLQVGDTDESPSATVDIESEALGDGTYVVKKTEVPEVFDARSTQLARPDVLPTRFTARVPTTTVTETVAGTDASSVSLGANDLSAEKQRISAFELRSSTVSRDDSDLPSLLGLELEEAFNVQFPYSEEIEHVTPVPGEPPSLPTVTGSSEVTPLDKETFLVKKYDLEALDDSLSSYYESFPNRVNLNLPKILKSISVKWDDKTENGEQFHVMAVSGSFTSLTLEDKGRCTASVSATPQFDVQYEEIEGTNLFATTHLFFLKSPVTMTDIISRCNSGLGLVSPLTVKQWPVFHTKSYNLTAKGASVSATVDANMSLTLNANPGGQVYSKSAEYAISRAIDNIFINIPPCIHGNIVLSPNAAGTPPPNKRILTATPKVRLSFPYLGVIYSAQTYGDLPAANSYPYTIYFVISTSTYYKSMPTGGQTPEGYPAFAWYVVGEPEGQVWMVDNSFEWPNSNIGRVGTQVSETVSVDINLPATKETDIPRSGVYLIDSNVEPFRHGFFLVRAVTINAAQFATT